MKRSTANTLRVIGIVFTILLTLGACGVLLLLSMCSGGISGPYGKGGPYLMGAFVAAIVGIFLVVFLVRRIARANAAEAVYFPNTAFPAGPAPATRPAPGAPREAPSGPLRITADGQEAIDQVMFALVASFVVSLLAWFINMRTGASTYLRSHLVGFAVVFVLYHAPYAAALIGFLKKPTRLLFYYTLATSGVLVLITLFTVATYRFAYLRTPATFLMAFLSWAVDIVIFVLGWRAMRKNDVQADSSALVVAVLVSFVYFVAVRAATPLLYSTIGK